MKTILHLIDQTHPGGAQTVFVELATGFDPARWRSVAGVPGEGWVADSLRRRGIQPTFTPVKRGPFDLRYLLQIVRLIRTQRVDLVHAHLLGPAVYASMAGLLTGVPVVTTFHGHVDVAPDERFRRLKFALIQRAAGSVVFVSEHLRQYFLSVTKLDPARTTVVHNGVDFEGIRPDAERSFREEIGVSKDEILVGAIGHLRPPKAYDVLLRAAAQLRKASRSFRFVIAGQPEGTVQEELNTLQDELGLGDAVTFTGFRQDIDRVINALDVYVITSSTEGFSLSAVQAMASGIPVVSTRCGGPEEIITNGETGILVDVGRPDAIAQAVTELSHRSEKRDGLARRGQESVRERFSLERMLSSYERIYRQCVAQS